MKTGLIAFAILMNGCTVEQNQQEALPMNRMPHGVTYEIFVQSFYDHNGDGIGDLNGVRQKLDYLVELGIERIWLMPIMPSPSYHKYDVTDYRNIHQDYGSLEDFKLLVQEAHDKNIQVLLDLVVNHTSWAHPWFRQAKQGPNNPFRDYYMWADKDSIADVIEKKTVTYDSDNLTQWHAVRGNTRDEHYYGFFYKGMPDLNFDNPKVKSEVFEIGKYWLTEMEVDGFRLDAAKYIFPENRAEDNHRWWLEFRAEMQKYNPNVYLVGEVWAETDITAPFLQGLSAVFNFDMSFAIPEVLNAGKDTIDLIGKYIAIQEQYSRFSDEFVDATFLKNHDQNRILSELGGDLNKAKVAASLLLTLPGSPYLYYGEELGMLGKKPDEHIREPFLWKKDSLDPGQPRWIKAKYSTSKSVRPLDQQIKDPGSLYHHYKSMIGLRKENEVLRYGNVVKAPFDNAGVLAFIRSWEGRSLLVVHNISPSPQKVDLGLTPYKQISFKNDKASEVLESSLKINPYSIVILE